MSSTPAHRTAAPPRNPRSHGPDPSATAYKLAASPRGHELLPLFPPPPSLSRELRHTRRPPPSSSPNPRRRRRRCRWQRQWPPPTPRPRRLRRRRTPTPTRTPRQRRLRLRPPRRTRTHHRTRTTICRNRGGWSSRTLRHTTPWWPRRRHLPRSSSSISRRRPR